MGRNSAYHVQALKAETMGWVSFIASVVRVRESAQVGGSDGQA